MIMCFSYNIKCFAAHAYVRSLCTRACVLVRQVAARSFPEVHSLTDSRWQPGSLVTYQRRRQKGRAPLAKNDSHSVISDGSLGAMDQGMVPATVPADRSTLEHAMARLRSRLLREGLCGVRQNSSVCVGAWCRVGRREWGAHASKLPWE